MEYKERDKRRWEERKGEKRRRRSGEKIGEGGDGRSVERRGGEGSRVDNIKQK